MKTWIIVLALMVSSIAFADTTPDKGECLDRSAITADTNFVEMHLSGSFAVILIPTKQAAQFIENSEKVAQGKAAPYCEKITDNQEGAITEYTACYSPETIDLRIFGSFMAVSVCTAELKAVLPSTATSSY